MRGPSLTDAARRLWPTPTDADWHGHAQTVDEPTAGQTGGSTLPGAVRQWPTPTTVDDGTRCGRRQNPDGKGGRVLSEEASTWATPTEDWESCGNHPGAKGGDSLTGQTRMWPTPAATPYGSSQNGINGKGGEFERPSANTPGLERMSRSFLPLLPTSTDGDACSPSDPTSRQRWPSPTVMDSAGFHGQPDTGRTSPNSGHTLAGVTEGPARKAKLNANFVEWLMGWPIGWTASALAATEWSHWQQRMRSSLWQLAQG
jgi:hypothetical protein